MTTETACPQCYNPLFDARDDADSHRICILCGWRTRDYEPEYIKETLNVRYIKHPNSPKRNQFPRTKAGQLEYIEAADKYWRQRTKTCAPSL